MRAAFLSNGLPLSPRAEIQHREHQALRVQQSSVERKLLACQDRILLRGVTVICATVACHKLTIHLLADDDGRDTAESEDHRNAGARTGCTGE